MNKIISFLLFILILISNKFFAQEFISTKEDVLLLMEPKLHTKRILIKPKERASTLNYSDAPILKIKPITKDTIGKQTYYFVELKISNEEKDRHYGYVEKNDLSKKLSVSIDSVLNLIANYAFTIVSEKRFCDVGLVVYKNQNSTPESQLHGLNSYALNNEFYIFNELGKYKIPKINKELDLKSGRMQILKIYYKKKCVADKSELLNISKYYTALVSDTLPPKNRLMNGSLEDFKLYWSGNFIDGLANGVGELTKRNFAETKYLFYKGDLLDDLFNGYGTCFGCNKERIQTGQWQYGEFLGGETYCRGVNLDSTGRIQSFVYGDYFLDAKFVNDSNNASLKVKDTLYENYLVKDKLYPEHLLSDSAFGVPTKNLIINNMIKYAFVINSSEELSHGGSSHVLFNKGMESYGKDYYKISRDIFIVCNNGRKLIYNFYYSDKGDGEPHFAFSDLKGKVILTFKNKLEFIPSLKKSCGCK